MRDRFNNFVKRNENAWELGMAALAIVYVGIGFAAESTPQPLFEIADPILTVMFLGEFSMRIAASRKNAVSTFASTSSISWP